MSDFLTRYSGFLEGADLGLDDYGLATDGGLSTAIILSLFTDARDDEAEQAPAAAGADPRGWWGDLVPLGTGLYGLDGLRLGSRLWTLQREKQLPEVVERARLYAEEALAWMVTLGVAAAVTVDASNPRAEVLALAITVERPDGTSSQYEYQWEWMRDAL